MSSHALGLGQVLAWAALSTLGVAANAQVLSYAGSFSGTVQANRLPLNFEPPHPESYWDGAAVAGSFEVRLVDPQYQFGADPHIGFVDPAGYLRLTYLINGQTFQYEAGAVPGSGSTLSIELSQYGATQQVDFRTSFQPKYAGGGVSFVGPGLFTDFDPLSIALTNGNAAFSTSFADPAAEMAFTVDVAQASYGAVGVIPEPSTFALFALGTLALAAGLRRRAA